MLVGIAGKKQVGKSTVSAHLEDDGFWRVSFAHTLKLMARIMLRNMGLTEAELVDAEMYKERPLPIFGVSYRQMLQTLGTDWARKLNPDVWLLCTARELESLGRLDVVIEDVRFDNEAELIRRRGGLIIHIVRDERRADTHASEQGVQRQPGDAVIGNNGSIDGLLDRVRAAIEYKFGEQA